MPSRTHARGTRQITVCRARGLRAPGFARNRGAELASGEWLLFIDADTLPSPTLIDDYFRPSPHPATGVLAGAVVDVCDHGNGHRTPRGRPRAPESGQDAPAPRATLRADRELRRAPRRIRGCRGVPGRDPGGGGRRPLLSAGGCGLEARAAAERGRAASKPRHDRIADEATRDSRQRRRLAQPRVPGVVSRAQRCVVRQADRPRHAARRQFAGGTRPGRRVAGTAGCGGDLRVRVRAALAKPGARALDHPSSGKPCR